MIDIREHGGNFGGGSIRKGQRIPFEKTTGQQPLIRFSHQLGNPTNSQGWSGFYYDKDKQVIYWINNNGGSNQWIEYKIGMSVDKKNYNYKDVTPSKSNGMGTSLSGGPIVKVLKHNNKYFIFYSSGLCVVDAVTMKIISEHTGASYVVNVYSLLQRRGKYAYYNLSNALVRLDLDNPTILPIVLSQSTNDMSVIDKNEQYFYRISGNSLVKYTVGNVQVYSIVIGVGETFIKSYQTVNIHPKTGNILILAKAASSYNPVLIVVTPAGEVVGRYTYLDAFFNEIRQIDFSDNHIVVSGGTQFIILDMNYNLLSIEAKESPSGFNLIAMESYLMFTWEKYMNSSSIYANLIYELDILI